MTIKKNPKEFVAVIKTLFVGLWQKITGRRPIKPQTAITSSQLSDLVSKLINCCDE